MHYERSHFHPGSEEPELGFGDSQGFVRDAGTFWISGFFQLDAPLIRFEALALAGKAALAEAGKGIEQANVIGAVGLETLFQGREVECGEQLGHLQGGDLLAGLSGSPSSKKSLSFSPF